MGKPLSFFNLCKSPRITLNKLGLINKYQPCFSTLLDHKSNNICEPGLWLLCHFFFYLSVTIISVLYLQEIDEKGKNKEISFHFDETKSKVLGKFSKIFFIRFFCFFLLQLIYKIYCHVNALESNIFLYFSK